MVRFQNTLTQTLSGDAEISWIATEFDYSITHQSIFFYETNQYYNSYNEYVKKDDASASYVDEATIQISEFQDIPQAGSGLQIDGLAKGPENGVDPPNGILVQAFLSTTAQGLNDEQGVDISTLEALSRVARKFGVDQPDTYTVNMVLTGLADFNSFYVNGQYQAWYTVETEVTLEELVGSGEDLVVSALPGFPVVLDESSRTASVEVQLRSLDDQFQTVTYRVKIELILTTRIDNLAIQNWLVAGNVNGVYQLGSSQAPFKLKAIFNLGDSPDSDQDGVPDDIDNCPDDSNFDQLDSDGDGLGDVCDGCPTDPLKTVTGICGCGVADTDTDDDGTPDCIDGCPSDANKTEAGVCGCGVADIDNDQDGVYVCQGDACDNDPDKTEPGVCGCGVADTDTDDDGTPDCIDGCPSDANKTEAGVCGCGVADIDNDQDGVYVCQGDACDNDPDKTEPGVCGCGVADTDTDDDGTPDCVDGCPSDANKTEEGVCGCGVADIDNDQDGVYVCQGDACDNDPDKTEPGVCGCGVADTDTDDDGTPDCIDGCPSDANKTEAGVCGCGVADIDNDQDGVYVCQGDACDNDPDKTEPGVCGCGVADTDTDDDGTRIVLTAALLMRIKPRKVSAAVA